MASVGVFLKLLFICLLVVVVFCASFFFLFFFSFFLVGFFGCVCGFVFGFFKLV